MAIENLTRSFRYNGVELPDPAAHMTLEQVRDLYSANFPELTTAAIEGPTVSNGCMVYTFARAVGAKG